MFDRDPHRALKSEVIGRTRSGSADLLLVKLQYSKNDIGLSLHISLSTFTLSGIQITDFLGYLGFKKSTCPFVDSRQCYVHWVTDNFDVDTFAGLLDRAFENLIGAQKDLERCGFFFDQPEGWSFFFGRQTYYRQHDTHFSGDGHTALTVKSMKQNNDEVFYTNLHGWNLIMIRVG